MRTRSAARIQGDDYHHLVAWRHLARALHHGADIVAVEMETPRAGSFDDVVVIRETAPDEFIQVKWAVDASSPVSCEWLTRTSSSGATSILQKFHQGWRLLASDPGKPPILSLTTNRNFDPNDDIFRAFDQHTQTLAGMETESRQSKVASVREQLATHLDVGEDELVRMLRNLRFQCGRDLASEIEVAKTSMLAAGLRDDDNDLAAAVSAVRSWIAQSKVRLEREDIRAKVEELGLRQTEAGALVTVQAIDADPHPEDAAVLLDWRAHFPGMTPADRVEATSEEVWDSVLAADLAGAKQRLQRMGVSSVVVRGKMRLPSWFAAGAAFQEVAGFNLSTVYRGVTYNSERAGGSMPDLTVQEEPVAEGEDLAVAIAISTDLGDEPLAYLQEAAVPVRRLVIFGPTAGPNPLAISSPEEAVAYAVRLRDAIRDLIRQDDPHHLHLFLAVPHVLALMLGHRWNRMRPTKLYEHLGLGRGYQRAFTIKS